MTTEHFADAPEPDLVLKPVAEEGDERPDPPAAALGPGEVADALYGLGAAIRALQVAPASLTLVPGSHEVIVHFGHRVEQWRAWADAWLCVPGDAVCDQVLDIRMYEALGQIGESGWLVRLTCWQSGADPQPETGAAVAEDLVDAEAPAPAELDRTLILPVVEAAAA